MLTWQSCVCAGAHALGPGARARLAEEAERREAEAALDASLKRREEDAYRTAQAQRSAAVGGGGAGQARPPPAWVFDASSGYHRDAHSGFLFDPASKQYFDPNTRAWGAKGPDAGACGFAEGMHWQLHACVMC